MCMLCSTQWYRYPGPKKDRDKLRAQAVKSTIEIHERVLREQAEKGETLCEASQERLAALRQEQYELAKRI